MNPDAETRRDDKANPDTPTAKPKKKKPVSEAKLKANRENARKSTGPRTDEGKAASRMNAVTHGMRTVVDDVLPHESRADFDARLVAWTAELKPVGSVETYLARAAVAASWRRDRGRRTDTAVLTDRVLDAIEIDPDREDADAEKLAEGLAEDPSGVRYQLRATLGGCRWMLARWDYLARALELRTYWEISDLDEARRLMGLREERELRESRGIGLMHGFLSAMFGTEVSAEAFKAAVGPVPLRAMGTKEPRPRPGRDAGPAGEPRRGQGGPGAARGAGAVGAARPDGVAGVDGGPEAGDGGRPRRGGRRPGGGASAAIRVDGAARAAVVAPRPGGSPAVPPGLRGRAARGRGAAVRGPRPVGPVRVRRAARDQSAERTQLGVRIRRRSLPRNYFGRSPRGASGGPSGSDRGGRGETDRRSGSSDGD